MTPASPTTAAEAALGGAGNAVDMASGQLRALDAAIQEAEAEARAAGARIARAHAAGAAVPGDLRAKRRSAEAHADDLRRERKIVVELLERRREEERAARVELEQARRATCRDQAAALGDEIRVSMAELAELAERLAAIDTADRRSEAVMRGAGSQGPWTPGAYAAAGLEQSRAFLRELVRRVQSGNPVKNNAAGPPAAASTLRSGLLPAPPAGR